MHEILDSLKLSFDGIQASLVKDPGVSVNRVIWSPDGTLFGKHWNYSLVDVIYQR